MTSPELPTRALRNAILTCAAGWPSPPARWRPWRVPCRVCTPRCAELQCRASAAVISLCPMNQDQVRIWTGLREKAQTVLPSESSWLNIRQVVTNSARRSCKCRHTGSVTSLGPVGSSSVSAVLACRTSVVRLYSATIYISTGVSRSRHGHCSCAGRPARGDGCVSGGLRVPPRSALGTPPVARWDIYDGVVYNFSPRNGVI